MGEELGSRGYSGMTFESVAERAGTSKAVLYRRWASKQELFLAALHQRGVLVPVVPADTGSLRGDVIALLENTNRLSVDFAATMSGILSAYFDEAALTPAQLRAMAFSERRTGMEQVIDRAVERGDIPAGVLPPRLVSLPSDLYRKELIMTLEPVSRETIAEIVDVLFLPLVARYVAEA